MKGQFSPGPISLYWLRLLHTVRYLRWQQIFYRLYYPIKRQCYIFKGSAADHIRSAQQFPKIIFPSFSVHKDIFYPQDNTFLLLHQSHTFGAKIDWNHTANGMLWCYNLNYFDWLNDNGISIADRLNTVNHYIEKEHEIKIGRASYPTSLRIVNWIKFLSSNQIRDEHVIRSLHKQANRLYHFPEYHLMGNHLLENGWALLWAASFFDDQRFYLKGAAIVQQELDKQILNDGAHFERSPMYHALILQHFLELNMLIKSKRVFLNDLFYNFIKNKTSKMLGWAVTMKFNNHLFPNFADSTIGVTASWPELETVAQDLTFDIEQVILKESGYRKIEQENTELLFNCGGIAPDYQPGHAHADLFSLCLNINNKPVIVDTGISTYEKNERRLYERSTRAHNSICVNGANSSDVWASFRVAHRAKAYIVEETPDTIVARHDGYKRKYGIIHERSITRGEGKITIVDKLMGWKGQDAKLFLHFHPGVNIKEEEGYWNMVDMGVKIKIKQATVYSEQYEYCEGFNKRLSASRLVAQVNAQTCTTVIEHAS